jgi:hypothetical protein
MDEINQIYANECYSVFLRYCELHGYKWMRDLTKCRFEELPERIHISPLLLSRIKTTCVLYFKKHPDCLKAAKPKKAAAAPAEDLKDRLLVVFQQNANKLIHISDITKALGKGAKRGDIVQVLECQTWCKIVDGSTFFYNPAD